MSAPDEITNAELQAAAVNIDFFAVRLKGILALGEKMKQLGSLMNAEREIRARLTELQTQADAVNAVVATGDAAKQRLDELNAEIERQAAALETERTQTIERANTDVNDLHAAAQIKHDNIVTNARGEADNIAATARLGAEQILAEARDKAAAMVNDATDQIRSQEDKLSSLTNSIATRQVVLDDINNSINELRAKIGAR